MNTVNLKNYLKKDTEGVKKLKSLLDMEYEYRFFLGAIEYSLGEAYLVNKGFSDNDAVGMIKNLKEHHLNDISSFKTETEKNIIGRLFDELQRKKISHHELSLAFDYILWAISNRSWLNDKQAYVKWNAYHHGLLDGEEYEEYRRYFRKRCEKIGVPKQQIDAILDGDIEGLKVDTERAKVESEYVAAGDKSSFVVDHMLDCPFLVDMHGVSLEEENKNEEAISFYKTVLEKIPEFPPIECSLGLLYEKVGNKSMAQHHIKTALRVLNEMPSGILSEKQSTAFRKELNTILKRVT